MLQPPIAFISQLSAQDQQCWLEQLRAALPGEQILPAQAMSAEQRSHCDIAIVANPDPAELRRFPALQWIQSLWAGVERLVAELDNPPFNIVRLVDPYLAQTMAEAVLAWTLYLHRDMPAYARQQQQKHWQQLPCIPASQRSVGILGLGELGRLSAQRLADNGFIVSGWSRSPKQIPGVTCYDGDPGLKTLLAESQILICLLPLTQQTRGMIDTGTLARLPRGASLINFARGPLVRSTDLLDALHSGQLSHAVLDVFDQEPLPPDSPLWQHPKITVLPHISAPTPMESATRVVAANIRRYRQSGEQPAAVDTRRGY